MQHQHQQQAFPQQNHAPSAVAEDNSCFERQRQHAAAHYANKPPVSNVPSDADNRSTVYRVEAPPSTAPSVYEDPQVTFRIRILTIHRETSSKIIFSLITSTSNDIIKVVCPQNRILAVAIDLIKTK